MRALVKTRATRAVKIAVACAAVGGGTLAVTNSGAQNTLNVQNAHSVPSLSAPAPVVSPLTVTAHAERVSYVKAQAGGTALAAAAKRTTHKRTPRRRAHRARHNVTLVPAVASWYYDQGSTACGFHAHYGVANKTLPCGTKVEIRYGSRTVTATVDDRGPYVSGRSFDLDQTTAGKLGMSGVETVLVNP